MSTYVRMYVCVYVRMYLPHICVIHSPPALLVGYEHAGVPIKTRLRRSAKELFQNSSKDAIAVALDVVSPHILYQIGALHGVVRRERKRREEKRREEKGREEKRREGNKRRESV